MRPFRPELRPARPPAECNVKQSFSPKAALDLSGINPLDANASTSVGSQSMLRATSGTRRHQYLISVDAEPTLAGTRRGAPDARLRSAFQTRCCPEQVHRELGGDR